jgi:hypothetical protein
MQDVGGEKDGASRELAEVTLLVSCGTSGAGCNLLRLHGSVDQRSLELGVAIALWARR